MRLILASNGLSVPGGSETYLVTLGRHLQRFGHEVHAMAGPGNDTRLPEQVGLPVVGPADDLPGKPDRIIVQDAIVAGEAAARWPDVPQLFVVHSGIHDLQLTSAVPSTVAAYVVLNDRTKAFAEALPGERPVHRLTQPVDVGHFTPASPPADSPRHLLVFGNNRASWRFAGLEAECAVRGIEVRRLGAASGNVTDDPAPEIRAADIVVGYGRCILEAMACGRTALVFDRFGCDGWVSADSYPALESAGFNGRSGEDVPGRADFGPLLDDYDPASGAVGYDLAVRNHDARVHTKDVVEILRALGPVEPADPELSFTLARVWREAWRWETRALDLHLTVDELEARLRGAHDHSRELQQELDIARGAASAALTAARQDLDEAAERAEHLRLQVEGIVGSRSYKLARFIARARHGFRRV